MGRMWCMNGRPLHQGKVLRTASLLVHRYRTALHSGWRCLSIRSERF